MTKLSEKSANRLEGMFARFKYPSVNSPLIKSYLEPRVAKVIRVRDTDKEPLEPATIRENPLIKRGRFLIYTEDLMKGEVRRFYLDSMQELKVSKQPPPGFNPDPRPCQIVLVHGTEIREIANDQIQLNENEAGRWIDLFNRLWRRSKWRAALVRKDSLKADLPNNDRPTSPLR